VGRPGDDPVGRLAPDTDLERVYRLPAEVGRQGMEHF
jgi:hypothetical protein